LVAESLELVRGVAASAFGVAAGVVVGARVVVERSGVGHVPDRDQDRVFDRDECFLGSAAGGDASVLGGEVGAVAVRDGSRGGAERSFQVGVAGPGRGRFDSTGGLVAARAGSGPGG
jgi:hypothetical protein